MKSTEPETVDAGQLEDGVICVKERQIGRPEYLDRFEKTWLTSKGRKYLSDRITRDMDEDEIRPLVAGALRCGY